MVLPDSHKISRVPWYSGYQPDLSQFRIRGCHPLRHGLSRTILLSIQILMSALQPHCSEPQWFGLLRFRSPLLTELFLFLRVLRCFNSPSSPLYGYVFTIGCSGIPRSGFPHSEICGSKPLHNSPQLIAVLHVLHRLLTPRHSPCALSSLICKLLFTTIEDTLILFSF